MTVVVDQKDTAFKTEPYLAFFHERKSLLADKREQAGTSGMRLQGIGKWEIVCLIISSSVLFDFLNDTHMFVCVSVCLSVSLSIE